MPPTKTPGIRSSPVCQETYPALAYAKKASAPVGGINAIKLVPCARCCPKAKNSAKNGTKRVPPPIPNNPEAMPQRHAAPKIPASRIGPSPMGCPLAGGRHCSVFRLRFSPKQERSQNQKAAEQSLEIPRSQ